MKIAALLCGLIAGLAALLAPIALDLDLMAPFLGLWAATPAQQMLGTIAWYAIPAAALAGGLLAVLLPGFAALLLLGAAAAWLAAGLQDPALLDYVLLVPMGIAVLGAVLAFLAGELDVRQQRRRRRSRRQAALLPDPEELEDEAREAALRIDPQLMTRERGVPPPEEIPLELEDVVEVMPPPPQPKSRRWDSDIRPEPLLSQPAVAMRETPPRRRERRSATSWLVAANLVLIAIIGLGVGYVLLSEGWFADYLGQPPTTPPPQAEVQPPAPATVKPPEPVKLAATQAPAAAPAAAAAEPQTYTDPFAYCAALGTIDFVDGRYAGPPVAAPIAAALAVPANAAPDRVRWRCFGGEVYACSAYTGPVCDLTPTIEEMIDYCQMKQQVQELAAPHGTWSCRNGRPELPSDASWPVDSRGFYPSSWMKVPQPASG